MPTYDGDALLGDHGEPIPYPCSVCGAMGRGKPPHGWEAECPQKLKIDEAYVAMLDAQRMSFIRSGLSADANQSIAADFKRLVGPEEDE